MIKKDNRIRIVKVVSRIFLFDIISSIQNMFGVNLSSYEKMINKGMLQIDTELNNSEIILKWYRYEITELTNGALVIMMYGDSI